VSPVHVDKTTVGGERAKGLRFVPAILHVGNRRELACSGCRFEWFADSIFTEVCDMAVFSHLVTSSTRCNLDVERSINSDLATFS